MSRGGRSGVDPEPQARSARRVAEALRARGVDSPLRELPDSTRTVPEAARAVGCEQAQIVKSLVFRTASDGPLLVLVPGDRQVDLAKLAREAGEPVERAPAAWVRERTGFAVGGIPPLGHAEELTTLVDRGLVALPEVWPRRARRTRCSPSPASGFPASPAAASSR